MQLEKDKLYISFHRPKSIVGFLISAWTFGQYSHCEFIYNNQVFLSNPGGVRERPFKYKKKTLKFLKWTAVSELRIL